MGHNQSTHNTPPPILRPPPPVRRTSSSINRTARKRSLELPEFAALALTPASAAGQSKHPPSASIPIPMAVSIQQPPSPPRFQHYTPPKPHKQHHRSAHKQYAPHPQPAPAPALQQRTLAPVQEDAITVRSALPLGFSSSPPVPTAHDLDEPEGTQETTIVWRAGGKNVYLIEITDGANKQIKMVPEPSTNTFLATVRLPPGNHSFRFLVDDQSRVSDSLPTATDDDGTLINYIEIPSPPNSPSHQLSSSWENGKTPISAGPQNSIVGPGSNNKTFPEMPWTSEIPPRLHKLAAEEEAYLAARAAAAQNHRPSGYRSPPLPPPPPVPYPPSLPRHLEKVILNSSASRHPQAVSTPAILSSASSARPRIINDTTHYVHPSSRKVLTVDALQRIGGTEGSGDDNSVLPVPTHVVLNHLGTSAIKNGVLAVGTTTRYHRKYISTIYYKPVMA
ncbi:hypothetical protein FRC03_002365 [Tulasnella sp. 419]|nr:hypothetical protein FRC03_002365 [Tulasnella sp. 419]